MKIEEIEVRQNSSHEEDGKLWTAQGKAVWGNEVMRLVAGDNTAQEAIDALTKNFIQIARDWISVHEKKAKALRKEIREVNKGKL